MSTRMGLRRLVAVPCAALLSTLVLGGCPNPAATRSGANLLAAYTTKVKQDIQSNASARDELATARRELVARLDASATETEQSTLREVAVFRIARDTTALKLYENVRAVTQAEMRPVPEPASATPADTRATAANAARLEKLASAAKTLTQLGTERDWSDELKFYGDFIEAVDASVSAAKTDADTQSAAGKKDVSEAAKTKAGAGTAGATTAPAPPAPEKGR